MPPLRGPLADRPWVHGEVKPKELTPWKILSRILLTLSASIGGYIIEPSIASIGERLGSWLRFFVMLVIAAYLPHVLLALLGLAGDGVRAGDYDGNGH